MEPFEPFRKDLLAGKTTVITGGGTGLGRSMALRMAGLGAQGRHHRPAPEPLAETVGGHPRRRRTGRLRARRHPRAGGGGARARRAGGGARPGQPARSTTRPATSWPRRRTSPPTRSTPSCRSSSTARFHCTRELGRRLIDAQAEGRDPLDRDQLRGDGIRLRAALRGGQGGRAGHDALAGRGVGRPTGSVSTRRPRPLPHRGRVQPPHARLGDGEAGAAPHSRPGASASTGSSRTSWPT